eukprot:6172300-Pleurochrysis_carterae.AAC.3
MRALVALSKNLSSLETVHSNLFTGIRYHAYLDDQSVVSSYLPLQILSYSAVAKSAAAPVRTSLRNQAGSIQGEASAASSQLASSPTKPAVA